MWSTEVVGMRVKGLKAIRCLYKPIFRLLSVEAEVRYLRLNWETVGMRRVDATSDDLKSLESYIEN